MKKARNIGVETQKPEKECEDKNCPHHGSLPIRGRIFTGTVIGSKSQKTATVEWTRRYYVPKYERYEKRKTKIHVHNPPCINATDGNKVRIMETRPLSKTKHFVIIEKIGEDRLYREKKEMIEEDKLTTEKKKDDEKKEEKKGEEK